MADLSHAMPANAAVGRLFREHGDRIYSLGLRMCGSPDAAEDLVQETFLRALRSWDGFEGRSRPSTWLYTIASRACSRMRRRKAGEPRRMETLERLLPSGDEGIVEVPSADDPEAEAVRSEATDAIFAALAEVPLEFRLPFVLKEVVGLSVAEIADVLGVKEATIKTRLHRARLRVRKAIAGALPTREAPHPDHRREECLALLAAKQEALDRDVEFPLPDAHLCERCSAVFRTLDFQHDVCSTLGSGAMPDDLRRSLESALAG
jgi:RNA polymerase sigma-70 factor (ECF subfamily)